LAPDSTINDIKRLWIELRDLGIFPGSECVKRGKRDEDRYTFFVTIELFFRDVNKARSFVLAKKEKAKQKEAYLREIDTKEKENDTDSKRIFSKEVKPLRKIVQTTSNNNNNTNNNNTNNNSTENSTTTSPSRKISLSNNKKHPVLTRRKKGENGVEIIQEMDTAVLVEEKRKSSNFSFESFEDMQANVPTHRSGEYQRIMEKLKNTESLMEKT